ncbi:MAG: hypothetical protein ACOH2H_15225 [Cypionkella sp.]
MSQTIQPRPADDVLRQASTALGKVDLWGRRGVTMLSIDECEAMALLLAALGLIPTVVGKPAPASFFNPPVNTLSKDR